ncbi:hypothetical protein IDJ77_08975 [Mucilaginibacter sp. ZT4R22]|uniref:Uncharacterized protein n=1 Tax=Mucilaginibacter pankratovii TaxID=2772110 RepID=A0ABR7WNP2_9SPHI|nr:DUF6263 family protein [Mucilaginibacter pankratovii]MBD1363939.1 hypothetical protein [Mucilaginibacter pankratovii]
MKKYLTLSLLFIGISSYAQKVKLRLNLQKDSTYYLTTNANISIDQTISGTHQVMTTVITAKVAHKVTAITDTLYTLETTYVNMAMHMDMMDKTIDFSSSLDRQDIISKLLGSMLNRPFTITMSTRGRVVAVKGTDSLYVHMFDNLPPIPEEQKNQLKAQLQQSFGEKSIKANLQDSFVILPKDEIGVNGLWTTNNLMEAAAIVANTKINYSLKAITDDAYLIEGTGTVLSEKTLPAYRVANGIQMRMTAVSGELTTKVKLNKTTGWISENKQTRALKATVQIKDTPKTPGGMTYPMSIIADMTATGK